MVLSTHTFFRSNHFHLHDRFHQSRTCLFRSVLECLDSCDFERQLVRIKLKSYDYSLVDKSAEKIVKTVKATGAVVSGPIPLPTHKRIFTVNRSTFVNKKSREQFELSSYKRLIDIYSSTAKTVDALMKLELPSGVEVEIKV